MRTTLYVNGFNLYYGCLKNTEYRWLNVEKLFSDILRPPHKVDLIHYFTAHIKQTRNDPEAPLRQKAYLTALRTIPSLRLHYGHFRRHTVRMANAQPPPNTVEVIKTEEKGSDVNLSVHLLNDAWKDRYDCAVIVSDDSDMAEAMRLVKQQFPRKRLGLITPSARPTAGLKRYSDFTKTIQTQHLNNAQFSNPVTRPASPPVYKPATW